MQDEGSVRSSVKRKTVVTKAASFIFELSDMIPGHVYTTLHQWSCKSNMLNTALTNPMTFMSLNKTN